MEEFCKVDNDTKIKIINDWVKIKVDTEVRVSYLFLLGLTIITGMFLIGDECKKKNLNNENHIEKLYKLLEEKRNDDLKYFNEELLSYYAKNDGKEGKNFKIIFNSKLKEYFDIIYQVLYSINYKGNATFDEEKFEVYKNKMSKRYTKNPYIMMSRIIECHVNEKDEAFSAFANSFKNRFNSSEIGYVANRIKRYMSEMKHHDKNDVYDTLFLEINNELYAESLTNIFKNEKGVSKCIFGNNLYLISFDENMLKYIKDISYKSYALVCRYIEQK